MIYTNDMETNKDTQIAPERLEITAEPGKVIPKLATKVGVTKAISGNLILSFLCALPDEKPFLIERIVIDKQATDELIDLLKKMQEDTNG